MLEKRVQFLCVDVRGFVKSQLLVALHPSVLFITMWLTNEDAGYNWETILMQESFWW